MKVITSKDVLSLELPYNDTNIYTVRQVLANVYFLVTNHLRSQNKAAPRSLHLQDTALGFLNMLHWSWNLAALSRKDV